MGNRLQYVMHELEESSYIFNNKDFLLIGNGSRVLENTELDILAGKVDSNTAIIISAHGSASKKNHQTHLFAEPVYTSSLLKQLQDINPNICHKVFLDTCYSGYAVKDAGMLFRGSVLVTYSDIVHDNIFRSLKKFVSNILDRDNVDPLINYLENLHEHLYDKITFSFLEQIGLNAYMKFQNGPQARLKSVKLAPKIEELGVKGKLILNEAFQSFFKAISLEYRPYFKKAIEGAEENFYYYLARQLMHYAYVEDMDKFKAIVSYCKNNSRDCNFQKLIHIKDEFFDMSPTALSSITQYKEYGYLFKFHPEISYKELLVNEFHDKCEVID